MADVLFHPVGLGEVRRNAGRSSGALRNCKSRTPEDIHLLIAEIIRYQFVFFLVAMWVEAMLP